MTGETTGSGTGRDTTGPGPRDDETAGTPRLPEYLPQTDRPPVRGTRHRAAVWLVVAAPMVVLVVVAWAFARRPNASPAPPVTTAIPKDVADLPTGSPTDGLGTKMLPVRATPDKDLVDGQVVRVVGSGFPPGSFVGGVMCTGAARTQGAAACDLTNIGYNATADAQGSFHLDFPVRRFPLINGQRVDCMTGNVDPDDYAALIEREGPHPTSSNPLAKTCIIAVGEVSNYDNSGGWPIAFAGETFLHGGGSTSTTPGASEAPVTDAPAPGLPSTVTTTPSVPGPATTAASAPSTTVPPTSALPVPPASTPATPMTGPIPGTAPAARPRR